jgi:hypothetical protein
MATVMAMDPAASNRATAMATDPAVNLRAMATVMDPAVNLRAMETVRATVMDPAVNLRAMATVMAMAMAMDLVAMGQPAREAAAGRVTSVKTPPRPSPVSICARG